MQPCRWTDGLAALGAACVAGLIAMAATPAGANDSTARLDAGGLRLTFNPDIRMESEDLHISRAEVRVVYRFHNTGARDISTLVAFPLPPMQIGEGGDYALPGTDAINVVDFQVTVDGRPVAPSVEVKAMRFGVDVSAVLARHGIPVTMVPGTGGGEAPRERLDNLPAEARVELERHGLVDWNSMFGAGGKPLANPHWDAHIAFYWFQTFPAGRTIEVTHRYRPVPRQFFFSDHDLASAEMRATYCIDDAFARAVRAGIARSAQQVLAGYELNYVLTTAGNWMGPIRNFRLTVEKSSPDALVSLCGAGIRRAGPTSFVLSAEDYIPDRDLAILFVEASSDPN